MQRVDELEQQVSNLAEALAERGQRMIRLNDKLAGEKASSACGRRDRSRQGQRLEILTALEERVHGGQELLRMLDCSEPIVTAVVGQILYLPKGAKAPENDARPVCRSTDDPTWRPA
jgi:hypothetical protein